MKKVNIIILSVLILLWGSSLAFSQCETPPFVTGAVPPNVLIVLDTSGSMMTEVEPGKTRWDVAKEVVIQLIQDNSDIRFGLMRMDGSDYDGQNPPRGLSNPVLRQGGKLLRPCGTDHTQLIQFINAMPNNDPQTWTVLGETLLSAGRYFAGGNGPAGLGTYDRGYTYIYNGTQYDATTTDDEGNIIDTSSPIQMWCQKNFIIFITDGESSYDDDWSLVTSFIGDYDGDGEEPSVEPGMVEIIVDNPDGTYVGAWSTSTWSPGYYGADYHYHETGSGTDTFTWTPTITTSGTYEVFARWTEDPSRAPDATYTIHHDEGSTGVPIDQRSSGGVWVSLGTYHFDGVGDYVELTESPNGWVIADAIKIVPPTETVIVDNPDGSFIGSWSTSTWSPGYYGADYHYHETGSGTDTFTWTPTITTSGTYKIFARWTEDPSRAPDATYTIHHDEGSTGVPIDQRLNGGKWFFLGTYPFDGVGDYVELTESPNGWVIADAIKWGASREYMDDVAKFLYENDMSGLAGKQNIITYTIGFAVDLPLLQDAADNGGGLYYTCATAAELTESLQTVMEDIAEELSSGTAVAVLSTSQLEGDRLFRAKFMSDSWKGYLETFSIPYTEGDTPLWEAGALLETRSHTNRTIFTADNVTKTKVDFTDSNWDALDEDLGASSESEARDIINYIRGDNSNEQSQGGTYRNRGGWKLGDIVYSNPVVVGTPSYYYPEESYWTFVSNNIDREKVIYVGANDGMLHAFRVSDGRELWAFIPENLLGKLKDLTDPAYNNCHEYFVDLSSKAADVYIGGAWKTVLIGGERAGGKAYFALDVTDPYNPQFLWQFTNTKLGESWAVPAVGKVLDGGVDKYVMFVGSGFENGDTKGYFFAVDIASGEGFWERVSNDTINAVTSCTAVDEDRDSYIDAVYAGDLMGNIWKFDVSSGNHANWDAALLFHATDDALNDQPITVRPSISFDKKGNTLVYFGTGKFYDTEDKTDTQQQAFYCLIDDGTSPTVEIDKATKLVNQTIDQITELPDTAKGWYINLTYYDESTPSERVVADATVVADAVFFTTFIPNSDVCGYGGNARLWAVYYLTGGAATGVLEGLAEGERYIELGVGLPSAPVVSIKHDQVIVQTSDTTIHSEGANLNVDTAARIRAWREVF